jgi:putative FmdB family regulatory protein
MPIYEYACKSCAHTLDALQKMSDDKLVDCPECGKPELKRLLSAPRFRLKGQGWYETDFKKDNQRNLASDNEPTKKSDKAESDTATRSDSTQSDSTQSDSTKSDSAQSDSAKSDSTKSDKKETAKPKKDSKASTA